MALLKSYIRRFGVREGRKKFNEFHREYRKRNSEKLRAYWRAQNKKTGEKRVVDWQRRHPRKVKAENRAHRAIATGKIVKTHCVVCSEPKVMAHHPNYRRPLYVIFVCSRHHRQIHSGVLKLKTIIPK